MTLILVAAAIPAFAQGGADPFEGLDGGLAVAASRELQLVHPQEVPHQRDVAGKAGDMVQNTSVISLNSTPAFVRLQMLLPVIRPIFEDEGVPQDLMLVGLVESGYRPDAVSSARAVGMWQFMPETARRFGLIDNESDFRSDVLRSTRAAAKYLKFLLERFQDWRLALAAYNAGEDRVEEAIRKADSRDFSTLTRLRLLPEETVQYVPAVLSAIAQARNRGFLSRRSADVGGFYE
jgi:hypothetical protein